VLYDAHLAAGRARYSEEIGIRRELGTESPRESEGFIT
jgi:hypothetical protein